MNINVSNIIYKQQFRVVRNWRLLNSSNLLEELEKVGGLEEEFKIEDLEDITEAVKKKLNDVITRIAPFKRIQIKRDVKQIKDRKAGSLFEESSKAKSKAIASNDPEDFRKARNLLAIAKKTNYLAEAKEATKNLGDNNKKWKVISNKEAEEVFRTALVSYGKLITSQKKLADTLANTFESTVKEVRKNFEENHEKTMRILKKLCTQRTEEFKFKEVSREQMYTHILKSKSSKTTAEDAISMDVLRQIPLLTSKIMTKIFNLMIKEKIFPRSLKTARILALMKAGKCKNDPKLFRPISILNPLEKLLEEELKEQITSFFEENNIIPEQHHGGRAGHSTSTTKAVIDKLTADKIKDCEESIVMARDLSQAYDLVDHSTLVHKLRFHGVGNRSCELLSSFLADRTFFVEVQGSRLSLKELQGCSVIQGSKKGGFLYTAFNIEVVFLQRIMSQL